MNLGETPPTMPDDWWPDSVIVQAATKDGDNSYKLAFAITESSREYIKETIEIQLNALRTALWQAKYLPLEEYERYYGPKDQVNGAS